MAEFLCGMGVTFDDDASAEKMIMLEKAQAKSNCFFILMFPYFAIVVLVIYELIIIFKERAQKKEEICSISSFFIRK
jgi:predicted nucleic acid-binding Zn ribbon protein